MKPNEGETSSILIIHYIWIVFVRDTIDTNCKGIQESGINMLEVFEIIISVLLR